MEIIKNLSASTAFFSALVGHGLLLTVGIGKPATILLAISVLSALVLVWTWKK